MSQQQIAALLGLLVSAGLGFAGDEPARDLVPVMPVRQARIFDNRYYSGPSGNSFALAPDGKHAVGNSGGNQLMVYELGKLPSTRQGRLLQSDNPNFYRPALAFMPDSRTLLGISNNYPDYNVHIWDIGTGKEVRQIDNDQQFQSLAVSADGKLLALGTSRRIEVWDADTTDDYRILQGTQNNPYQMLAFSGDGRMLAGGTNDAIQVWELASGQERALLRLNVNPQSTPNVYRPNVMVTTFSALAFSADGALLATGGSDHAIRLWNLRSGAELPPLVGHTSAVTSLVFTADGRRLLSMDGSGLKFEWDTRHLNQTATIKLSPPSDGDIADIWESLADADAFQTYRAARLLAAAPQQALAFLQQRLQPVPPGNSEEINQLVIDLQNPSGAVRRKAMTGLRQHGEAALGALLKLAQNNQGINQNVSMMINKLEMASYSSDRQRALKAVQALEQIGNDEAKQLLDKLAKGASGAPLTAAAQAAADRLKTRTRPGTAEQQTLWDNLALADGKRAFAAVVQLAGDAEAALPLLRERLKPVSLPPAKQLEEMIAALDDADFATRQKATSDLDKIGDAAVPFLKKALDSRLSLEHKNRVEQLLAKHDRVDLPASQLQQLRAVEALEHLGSNEARQLLQELAQGAPTARLTREAQGSLARAERRVTAEPRP